MPSSWSRATDRSIGAGRLFLTPVLAGLTVGLAVVAAARFFGAASCAAPSSFPPAGFGGDCVGLVTTMAFRIGIAAGVATAVMLLLAAGLSRTAVRMAEDRHARAIERTRGSAADG